MYILQTWFLQISDPDYTSNGQSALNITKVVTNNPWDYLLE